MYQTLRWLIQTIVFDVMFVMDHVSFLGCKLVSMNINKVFKAAEEHRNNMEVNIVCLVAVNDII